MSAVPISTELDRAGLMLADHAVGEAGRISPLELAELIRAFNDVTSRLQSTHETLTAEVTRLKGELRDANQQLRRARELAALGEMAAGIAHEVRNPLGSIRLYASAMEEDLADRPEQRAMAKKIADAVRGLNAIVSDVLAFARELRIDPEPVSVGDLIDRSMAGCVDLADRSGVSVRQPRDDGRAALMMCDASLAQQALSNVLRNAIEATEETDGPRLVEIDVNGCQVRGSRGRPSPMIALSVRDHGPGVSDDVMRRMFNPFFTTRHAGTGLGLAIVHRIVDAHGGRVTVRNHDQGGAVVELMLPAAELERHAALIAAEGSQGGDA